MKARYILLALCLAASGAALAQETPETIPALTPAQQAPESARDRMVRELELTAEQVQELDLIDARHSQRAKELNRGNLSTDEKRAKTIELRDKKEAEIKAMLTTDQVKKYEASRQQQRDARLQQRKAPEQKKPAHQE